MPTQLQPPRGTHDLIGEDQRRHTHVVDTARRIAATYGFDEWTTPIFEDTRVFSRTLGETSDVVTKEMYSFNDRGGDSITLRPEATAGICRALVTNGLTQSLPQKVFCTGPMFRYERPQKGRYRQFHQIDIELIGPSEPLADAEVIACGWAILQALGVAGETVLEINTLGDKESRAAYRDALVGVFHPAPGGAVAGQPGAAGAQPAAHPGQQGRGRPPHRRQRAADRRPPDRRGRGLLCQRAHLAGPLRRARTGKTRGSCAGLDYYGHTAFEFVTTKLGAQGTVMGGGRYDGLVQEMGGPPTPAVGLRGRGRAPRHAAGQSAADAGARRGGADRRGGRSSGARHPAIAAGGRGMRAEMAYRGNLRRRMERANRIGARAA